MHDSKQSLTTEEKKRKYEKVEKEDNDIENKDELNSVDHVFIGRSESH